MATRRANNQTLINNLFSLPKGTLYRPTGNTGALGAFGANLPVGNLGGGMTAYNPVTALASSSNPSNPQNNPYYQPPITPITPVNTAPTTPLTQPQILAATNGQTVAQPRINLPQMALGSDTYIPPNVGIPQNQTITPASTPPQSAPVVMTAEQIWNMKANQRRRQMVEVVKPVFVRGQTFGVSKQQVTGRFSAG